MVTCVQAGCKKVTLNGCVGPCAKKVWHQSDESDVCEFCGTSRYNEKGQAQETVYWFPLREHLEKLLRERKYVQACRHEDNRESNPNYITG